MCKECIKKHIKNKNNFKVKCIPFAESLNSLNNPYYPLDKVLGEDKYSELSDDVKIEIQLSKNKLLWAKETLGWSTMNPERGFDQFYQREILLCTAKMKVVRCGRRMGKTEYIIIESLHTAINEPGTKILIIGPFQNLIDEIFERLQSVLSNENSIYKNKFKRKRKPNKFVFDNGSSITGFTTGNSGDSIRGQSADVVIFDEAAYIPALAFRTTLALLLDNKKVNQERLDELLRILDLKSREKHLPRELSGGQQQRVSIGRALMNAPSLVLADEPTGNLDSKNSKEIIDLLKLTQKRYKQTLIMITHDERIAMQADRIIVIEDGKIKKDEVLRK